MAIKIKTEDKTARQDTFYVSPKDIAKGLNARMVPSANYADQVRDRAIDIFNNGQLQPAEVRRAEDNTLILNFGFTRYDAVELLREGFETEGVKYHKPDAQLWVKVVDATEEEAFDRGVSENRQRNDTTDLQEAKAHEYYRTARGLNDTQIAQKYGYTNQNRVMALKKLLTLSESQQQLVHKKLMSLSAGVDLLSVEEPKREPIIKAATDEKTGKVSGSKIRDLIRQGFDGTAVIEGSSGGEGGEEGGEDAEEKKEPVKKRTVKNFNDFTNDLLNTNETPDNVKALFKTLQGWFADEKSDRQLWNAIDKVS